MTFDFVPGAVAKANDVDTNFNDLVGFLNNSVLHRDGSKTATAPMPFAVGSAASPSITFSGDADTGVYSSGADLFSISTGGVQRVEVGSATAGLLRVVASSSLIAGRFYRQTTGAASQVLQVASNVTAAETVHMFVETDGDVFNTNGTYGIISDRRLKKPESIISARRYLADLDRLQVRKYQMLGSDQELLGFIADEVAEVFPGLVKRGEDGFDSVKTSVLIPMLLSAVQELSQRVRELEAKVV